MKERVLVLLACLFASFTLAMAQTRTVRGAVVDEAGEPVIGASVLVQGTNTGTITDIEGAFVLQNVPSNATTLMVSFVGMRTQEVAIANFVNVTLLPEAELLDEVIVTAYGTSTKGTFTGSAGVMKADKIEQRQVSNITNALSGAVAGVQVLSDNGQPGVSAKIRIRGVGSINAGMDPLYVVDGVPFDGDLSSINSQDIESLTVLKDAASTALYGARGANGIIMITTKKGSQGKATVTVDAKWGTNSRQITNYDVMTSTEEYMNNLYTALYNGAYYSLAKYKGDAEASNAYANATWMTNKNGGIGYQIYTLPEGQGLWDANGRINSGAKLGYSDGEYYYTPDDWSKEMFKNKLRQEYNASISASNDRLNYYASFGYLNDQGIIEGSGLERITGRLKAEYKVFDWLRVGGNMAYTNSNSRYPGEQTNTSSSGNAFFLANVIAPVYPIYVREANGQIAYNKTYNRPIYDYGDGTVTNGNRSFMSIANPAGDLIYNKTEYLMDIMNLNWFAEFTPIKGLSLTARFGLNTDNTRYNDLGNALYGQSASYGGTAYQEAQRTYGFTQQYVGNYHFNLAEKHDIDLTAGYEGYQYEQTYVDASGQNLYNPDSYYINNTIDQNRGYGSRSRYATQGFFGRVNYSFAEKYIASVSFRRDASSRFRKGNRWGSFWSASAAWVITNENFMQNVSWIDMLKLKASFGQQGNDALGNYYPAYDQYRMTGANGVFADGTLYYKGNPDISWETSTTYNIGIDFALLENKLTGSLEYFGRQSSDMLYNKPTAPIAGYSSFPMNIGSMRNTGLELDLNYNILHTKKLNWDVNFNITTIKNKILELHPDLNGQMIDGSRIYEEGESMYRMYLVKYAGVNPETGEAQYWAKDENGQEIKTTDYSAASTNKAATKNLLPSFYGGFGTSFSAYGFDFSIQASYQLGGQIYDSGYARIMHSGYSTSAGQNWHKDIRNAWTPTNTNTDVPRLSSQDRYANSQSDRWLTSSDYLAINNITIGYTLPAKWTQKFLVSKLRVYASADNVALLAARKGLDPRQSFTSATTARYTPIRTISGGLSVTF